jgi:gliding motility-associated-like protein
VNGAAGVITAGMFTAVPNSGGQWLTAQVNLPVGTYPQGSVINISNSASLFHLGVLEGSASGGNSYGYFSNFGAITATATASANQVCVGDTIRLHANTVQGAGYQWSGPGGFSSIDQNPVIPNAGTSRSGVYTLTVDLSGCGKATDTVGVTVTAYPVVNLGNDLSVCADTITLRPTQPISGGSYLWSTGATTDSLRVTSSNAYWLRVSRNGCATTDTISVQLHKPVVVDLGPDIGICDRDTPHVLTSSQPAGAHYVWSNGLSTQQMSVSRTGRYWLEVTLGDCKDSDTLAVTVVPTPIVDLGPDTTICEQFPLRIGQEVAGADYRWNTGAAAPFIAVNTTDNYVLEVNLEGCIVYDTIVVTAMPPFIPDLGPDRDICPDEVMTLSANYSGMGTYLWSTGEVTSDIEVSEPGTYHVTVVSEYQCVGSDTVVLSLYPLPIVSLGQDTTVCEGGAEPVMLKPWKINTDELRWSDGRTGDVIAVTTPGTYVVTAVNKCGSAYDTIQVNQIFCDIWVPNVFTPNGDGINDRFRVLGTVGRLDNFSFSIFNRWGERVFQTQDRYLGWDGMHKGTPAPMDTYVYMLEYNLRGQPVLQKGNFHLLR